MPVRSDPSVAPGPRVTVCIPTRGRAPLLVKSIGSALAQTYPNLVVEVSDNASEDDTADRVAAIADPRVRYTRNAQDLGLVGNFAALLGRVTTELLMFVPDDDLLRPGLLENAVALLDAHPRVGLVHSAFDVVDEDDRTIETKTWTRGLTADTIQSAREFLRDALDISGSVCLPTAVMRREAVEGFSFRDSDFPQIDYRMFLEIAGRGWDVGYIARPLAGYRLHESLTTRLLGAREGSGVRLNEAAVKDLGRIKREFLREFGPRLVDSAQLRRVSRHGSRRDLVAIAKQRTLECAELSLRRPRFLLEAVRLDPGALLTDSTWRALGADVLHRTHPGRDTPRGPLAPTGGGGAA